MKFNLKGLLRLKKLKVQIGLTEDHKADFTNKNIWSELSPDDWELLNTVGAEAKLEDIRVDLDGTLNWKGHKVILHIYSVRSDGWQKKDSLPRFHIAECSTLQAMREKGAYDRYVVSQKTTGIFTINISEVKKEAQLQICRNCLTCLDYKSYCSERKNKQNEIVENFKIPEFFKFYDKGFYSVPTYTDQTASYDKYADNWKQISAEIRWTCHWICQSCKLDLSKDKKFLHVHHKNHIRSDNSPSNLAVLCIECHANQTDHAHIRRLKDYPKFVEKYIKKKAA
jgi:hypothetical protein